MKKKDNHEIWYNLEGEPFVEFLDRDKGQVVMDFKDADMARRFLIPNIRYMDRIAAPYASPNMTYKRADETIRLICPDWINQYAFAEEGRLVDSTKNRNRVVTGPSRTNFGTWLILHTDFRCDGESEEQSRDRYLCACFALRYGINLLDELKDAFDYPVYVWEAIAVYSMVADYRHYYRNGVICKKFRKNMTKEQAYRVIRPVVRNCIKYMLSLPYGIKELREMLHSCDIISEVHAEGSRMSPRRGHEKYNPEYPYSDEGPQRQKFFSWYK